MIAMDKRAYITEPGAGSDGMLRLKFGCGRNVTAQVEFKIRSLPLSVPYQECYGSS